VRRLRFIRRAKDLGFTLKEIGELLDLRVDPRRGCADVRELARAKMADVEAKMLDLARIQAALTDLVRTCRGEGPTRSAFARAGRTASWPGDRPVTPRR
jgi:MerR family mercuric resistance operon transcriptional regulator